MADHVDGSSQTTNGKATSSGGGKATSAGGAAPESTATKPTWAALLHEIFGILLAAAIAVTALWMIVSTYSSGGVTFPADKDGEAMKQAYERQKDILLYALTLFGTVTGYYFGRVPAERRAESAQQAADKATANAKEANKSASDASAKMSEAVAERDKVKSTAKDALREAKATLETAAGGPVRQTLGSPGAPPPGGPSSMQPAIDRMDRLIASLD